jgi:two-component system, NtrC family, nitrogen regulation sensor histidine kinase NtrY
MLKRFNIQVTIRVILLVVNIVALTLLFGNENYFFNQVLLTLIFVFQFLALIYYINKTNRDLKKLFDAVRNNDFSVSFTEKDLGKSFADLQSCMNMFIDAYKSVKIEKEIQYQFLRTLVNQLNIGVVSLEADLIHLINPKAESLLNIKGIRNWKLFREKNPDLLNRIEALGSNRRGLLEIKLAEGNKTVAAEINTLTVVGKELKIITFEDINSEIEQKEIEAWQRLIRIMTHEIMNSVTPIASLSETLQNILVNKEGKLKRATDLNDEIVSDLRFSLQTIHKRSEGLSLFVENYKRLSRIPAPEYRDVLLNEYLIHIKNLFEVQLKQDAIDFSIVVYPKTLTLHCDPALTEQVLINLISNSIHSLEGQPAKRIEINGYADGSRICVDILDNGTGIPDKVLPEIFVPFFSTRQNGSGIGLSLSKQIMRSQNGNIKVKSTSAEGTCFQLVFQSH